MLKELVLQLAPVALLCLLIVLVAIKIMMMANVPTNDKFILFFESFKMNQNKATSSTRKKAFYKKSDKANRVMYILFSVIVVLWLFMHMN